MLLKFAVLISGVLVFLVGGLASAFAPSAANSSANSPAETTPNRLAKPQLVDDSAQRFAAMTRHIELNGARLDQQQLHAFDQAACGQIKNGRYWLNQQTGFWGKAGNPVPSGRLNQCENLAG